MMLIATLTAFIVANGGRSAWFIGAMSAEPSATGTRNCPVRYRCPDFRLGAFPGAWRSASPSGPCALNLSTQSRIVCKPTPPTQAATGDWRGETLARVRSLIRQADPGVVEAVKWRKPSNGMLGVPV
jgi:hypothetical protein